MDTIAGFSFTDQGAFAGRLLINGVEALKFFDADLTVLQRQVLKLLSVPDSAYRG